MKKLLTSLLVTLTALALFTGCSTGMERLGIEVQLAKLERKTDGTLLATLAFSNPNVGSVNIGTSTHQLSLNGKPAGTLKITDPLGLPAQRMETMTAELLPTAGASVPAGTHSYQLKSLLIFTIVDDDTEKYKTQSAGTVVVP